MLSTLTVLNVFVRELTVSREVLFEMEGKRGFCAVTMVTGVCDVIEHSIGAKPIQYT